MVHVEQLSFTYPKAQSAAVSDLSFDVTDGEVFGFLGPSGAGKSTTQNILIGLLQGFSGTVEVMGKPLHAWGPKYYRHIGVSFEFPNHYLKLTARENLQYFRSLYGGDTESIESVLESVDLSDAIDQRVDAFSKGMKNRLNVARSLLHGPKLWILDEPTAGLDPVNALRIREIIQEKQRQGVTTFIATHDMTTADALCDRVAFIVDGAIAIIDSPEALRRTYGRREVEVTWRSDDEGERSASFPLDGIGEDTDFAEALRHTSITSIHSQETTLEDVFVQVTGRGLE
jgi:fluoroquinolone transport system ATP-binding protein